MCMFGQFPKINSWLNWQSIDRTRAVKGGEKGKYKFRVHHLITAKLIYGWVNKEKKELSILSIEEQTRKIVSTNFPFFLSFRSFHIHNIWTSSRNEKKIDITESSIHTQQLEAPFTGTFAFPWTEFSPKKQKKSDKRISSFLSI